MAGQGTEGPAVTLTPEEIEHLHAFAAVGLIAFTIASTALPIVFAFLSHGKWKETDLGRSIMFRDLLLASLLIFTTLGLFLRLRMLLLFAAVVLYWIGTFITIDRILIMLRAYTNRSWPWYSEKEIYVMPDKKPQPVLVVMSILVTADVILGGAALSDYLSPQLIGLMLLIVAGLKVGIAFYLRGQVVPVQDVAAFVPSDNRSMLVAGPAAAVPNDAEVRVTEVVETPENVSHRETD